MEIIEMEFVDEIKNRNIGIVTTWFERGAAYVSKAYYEALSDNYNVYIYARGGEKSGKGNDKWDKDYVTWGRTYAGSAINKSHLYKWIKHNNIDIVLFNEQREYDILASIKKSFPNIITGAYIDYYTEDTVELFDIYDFVICNTYRHHSVFKDHKQSFYVRWGIDTDLFTPVKKNNKTLVFFHSVGMSNRKGTDILIRAYIHGELYKSSKLVIHTQVPIENVCEFSSDELAKYNIEIIQKTVSAPGLYHLGDVYVYPTKLDGLGLTLYEALACGLPVITSDSAPMNEVIENGIGKLVKIENLYCRYDAYYWPLCICDENSLIECMKYYINNPNRLKEEQIKAREVAVTKFNKSNLSQLVDIFQNVKSFPIDDNLYRKIKYIKKREKLASLEYFVNHTYIYKLLYKRK